MPSIQVLQSDHESQVQPPAPPPQPEEQDHGYTKATASDPRHKSGAQPAITATSHTRSSIATPEH